VASSTGTRAPLRLLPRRRGSACSSSGHPGPGMRPRGQVGAAAPDGRMNAASKPRRRSPVSGAKWPRPWGPGGTASTAMAESSFRPWSANSTSAPTRTPTVSRDSRLSTSWTPFYDPPRRERALGDLTGAEWERMRSGARLSAGCDSSGRAKGGNSSASHWCPTDCEAFPRIRS
jgi:hypothetical protein